MELNGEILTNKNTLRAIAKKRCISQLKSRGLIPENQYKLLLHGVEILFHYSTRVFPITGASHTLSTSGTTVLTHGPSMQGLSYSTLRGFPVSAREYTLYTSKVHVVSCHGHD